MLVVASDSGGMRKRLSAGRAQTRAQQRFTKTLPRATRHPGSSLLGHGVSDLFFWGGAGGGGEGGGEVKIEPFFVCLSKIHRFRRFDRGGQSVKGGKLYGLLLYVASLLKDDVSAPLSPPQKRASMTRATLEVH